MAEGVYRYYLAGPNCVEAVTVSFWEESTAAPMFLLAQIQYSSNNALLEDIKGRCKEWDVWNLYFTWGEEYRTSCSNTRTSTVAGSSRRG